MRRFARFRSARTLGNVLARPFDSNSNPISSPENDIVETAGANLAEERLRTRRLHLGAHADRHGGPRRSPLGAELDKGGRVAWTKELERVDDRQVPDVQDGSPVVHRKVDGAPGDVKCPEETRWQDAAVEVVHL